MDRKKKTTPVYGGTMGRGVNYAMGSAVPGKKPKKKKGVLPMAVRLAAAVVCIAAIGLIANLAFRGPQRAQIGRVTRIGATLGQNVSVFGDSVLFYDGTTLHCISSGGSGEWSYQLGVNADYDAGNSRVVAWSGNDVYIFNDKGRLVFNNKMEDAVQFACAGDEYTAIYTGSADNGVIIVVDSSGVRVDSIEVSNQTLLDIGFFSSVTTSSAKPTELMWTLGLDLTGTVLSTELQTFQPGKLSTGKSSLGEHIAYAIYYAGDALNVVDTRQIRYYNYRALETGNPTLIYGYTLEDVRNVSGTAYRLLVPDRQTGASDISNVRLMDGHMDRMLRLPSPCLAVSLGDTAVYGFSSGCVYMCRYGQTAFTAYSMPMQVTAVLGMLSKGRAVVASGADIYVVELPM